MIKIKKYTTILMVAAMMNVASTGVGAEGLSVYCDNQKQVISGDIDTGTSGSLLIYLVGDNDDTQSIYGIDEADGNNGIYSVNMPVPDNLAEGWYLFRIEDYKAVDDTAGINLSERQKRMYIAPSSKANEAISGLNSATKSTISEAINQYADVLNISLDAYEAVTGEIIISMRPKQGFESPADFAKKYNKAKAIGIIRNSNNAEDAADEYIEVLDIEPNEDYDTYKDDILKLFVAFVKAMPITASVLEDTKTFFKEATALSVLNNGTRATITDILKKYSSVFGIELSGDYTKNSVEVNKALEHKDFTSISSVQEAYKKRLSELTYKPVNNSGGGSGGGGKSPSISYQGNNQPVAPSPTTEPTAPKFSDLTTVSWAAKAISSLCEKNIISGYDDGTFRPNNTVTREEFIKLVICAFNLMDDKAVYRFKDGSADIWYAPYIASAEAKGIITGYDDNKVMTRFKHDDEYTMSERVFNNTGDYNSAFTSNARDYMVKTVLAKKNGMDIIVPAPGIEIASLSLSDLNYSNSQYYSLSDVKLFHITKDGIITEINEKDLDNYTFANSSARAVVYATYTQLRTVYIYD